MPYGFFDRLMMDNSSYFEGKYFNAVSMVLNTRLMATAVYGPQPNGHTKRFSKTRTTSFCGCISELRND